MPPDRTEERLFALIDKLITGMDKMRRDMYIIAGVCVILFAAVTLARDGVFAKVGIPGVTFETHPAQPMPTDTVPPMEREPVTVPRREDEG